MDEHTLGVMTGHRGRETEGLRPSSQWWCFAQSSDFFSLPFYISDGCRLNQFVWFFLKAGPCSFLNTPENAHQHHFPAPPTHASTGNQVLLTSGSCHTVNQNVIRDLTQDRVGMIPTRPVRLALRKPFPCSQRQSKDFCLLACHGLTSVLSFLAGRMSTSFLSI